MLEISFSSPEILDDSEDELEDVFEIEEGEMETFNASKTMTMTSASFSRRSTIDARSFMKVDKHQEEAKVEDPVLEPGVIDFIAVVGCRDIGNQKKDDGTQG